MRWMMHWCYTLFSRTAIISITWIPVAAGRSRREGYLFISKFYPLLLYKKMICDPEQRNETLGNCSVGGLHLKIANSLISLSIKKGFSLRRIVQSSCSSRASRPAHCLIDPQRASDGQDKAQHLSNDCPVLHRNNQLYASPSKPVDAQRPTV